MSMRVIKKGVTDQSIVIRILDSTTFLPETAVEHNTAGIDLWYRREGEAKVSITETALTALTDAHSDGGFEHIGDGYYRLDPPDAAFSSGANGAMFGGTVTGMIVIGCYVHLVDYDPQDTVRLGLTALPNAAADAAGGLPISDAGGLDMDSIIRSLASGISDSGTTTTMVDAARTEADTDYWKGNLIMFTSGTLLGQTRLITGFTPGTDTITFAPATTVAAGTHTYQILPAGRVDVNSWLGTTAATPNVAGVPEVDLTHVNGVATTATLDTIKTETATILADTNDIQTRLPAALVTGRMDASVGAMAANTLTAAATAADFGTEIGTAVWAEATRTLTSSLDPTASTIAAAVWDRDATGHQTQGTFGQAIGDPVADTNTIYKAVVTDAAGATVGVDVVAVKAETASIQADTNDLQTQVGTAGAGLTNINLPNQTMDIVGNITGNLSGSVGSVTGLTAANLDATVSSRATPAQVNAEVVDALNVDAYAEPGIGAPAATTTLVQKIGFLYKMFRNRKTQTSTEFKLYADDGTTVDQKSTVSDDATTAERSEIVSGP